VYTAGPPRRNGQLTRSLNRSRSRPVT